MSATEGCRLRAALALCLALSCAGTGRATSFADDDYHLVVSKQHRELQVKRGDVIVRRYRVATGRGGVGAKRRQGDDITPVGIYHIVDLSEESKFHYFMQINYPNITDASHGYRDGLISREEFARIAKAYKGRATPPQDTSLGGFLGIHGIGDTTEKKLSIHEISNWTDGCIALTNQEINELRQYVKIGTQVVIND